MLRGDVLDDGLVVGNEEREGKDEAQLEREDYFVGQRGLGWLVAAEEADEEDVDSQ